MRSSSRQQRRGQALVMVTLSMVAMFGMFGLAMDLGWSYFVQKAAQTAADAAASAAAQQALANAGTGSLICGTTVTCASEPAACPASGNLQNACLYAQQNGFTVNGNNGRQNVTVQAGTEANPPSVPGVHSKYWVTVRVTERVPQLFSAVLGTLNSIVSARATAVIGDVIMPISLTGMNRENDDSEPGEGTDLAVDHSTLIAPAGILLSSTSREAGKVGSGGAVQTPFTNIRGSGGHGGLQVDGGSWQNGFTNKPEGPMFLDPMRGKGQPPLTSQTLPNRPVPGGTLDATVCPGGICPAGNYFAVDPAHPTVATGQKIRIGGDISFAGGAFGDFVFFGGLEITAGTVDFGPGRYVFAGTSDGDQVFSVDDATVRGGNGSDAGRLLILTDSTYPGLERQLDGLAAAGFTHNWTQLSFGETEIEADDTGSVSLYGLNRSSGLPSDTNAQGSNLKDFTPTVIWQDQRNSKVRYTSDGNIDTSCPGATLDSPCTNSEVKPKMELELNSSSRISGLIYQPRGASMKLEPAGTVQMPLQLVTGGVELEGSGTITLDTPVIPMTVRAAALVE